MSVSKLFTPLRIGDITLAHRVVMAPLTRFRADNEHVHQNIAVDYYRQRSVVPGTLLFTEGTFIKEEAGGYTNVPGIYTNAQIEAWRKVTDAVHTNKSFIALQLWALGRAAKKEVLDADNFPFVSASDIPIQAKAEQGSPRALTIPEIKKYTEWYATAAKNAIAAGFDLVEIHGANGYLVDQFTQDVSNNRTDEYGGSVENRARFALETVKAVADAVGEAKVGIRLGPWVTFQDMRVKNPEEQFGYLVTQLRDRFPSLAFIHLINSDVATAVNESNDFARKIWGDRPFLSAGGHDPASAIKEVEEKGGAAVFGKWFISNPDLPDRIKKGEPLTAFNPKTFYLFGPDKVEGYTDYPLTAVEQLEAAKESIEVKA